MMHPYTFLITSVIEPVKRPLSYTGTRSVYSSDQRLRQTLLTIGSIKKYVPNAKIVVIEGGVKAECLKNLRNTVEQVIYIGDNKLVRSCVDGKYKGLGEISMLLIGSMKLRKDIKNDTEYFFKLSGRYELTSAFDIKKWNVRKFCGKVNDNVISTRLYGFPKSKIILWKKILLRCVPKMYSGRSIEESLYEIMKKSKDLYQVELLGIKGNIAVDGSTIEE